MFEQHVLHEGLRHRNRSDPLNNLYVIESGEASVT